MRRSVPHDEAMAEMYRGDPVLALKVINGMLADVDQAELRIVLRQKGLAANGDVWWLAPFTGPNSCG